MLNLPNLPAPLLPQINLTQLTDGRNSFNNKYSVSGEQGFAPDILVCWPDLKTAVEVNGGIPNVREIVLKLIHRFNGTNWFLTIECCAWDKQTGDITAQGNRFDIQQGSIQPSAFQGDYDPAYFAHVLCEGQPTNQQQYVNNVIFPWYQQISEMHCQNNLPDNDRTIFAKFTSCSYDYTGMPGLSLVPWPHMVLILMNSTLHGDYVDDADYDRLFANRAADMGGMCPPRHNNYIWPQAMPYATVCLA